MNVIARYLLNVLIAIDQFVNVVFFLGSPDETISSRLGKSWRGDYGAKWRERAGWLRNSVNAFFRLFGQKDHCAQSIEEDEGK